ncbi:MAG TPA: hypothetical protein VFJ16_10015 [Longimicrobium sp.]|nr:hypothetical protein [Longimicrobium sp.]
MLLPLAACAGAASIVLQPACSFPSTSIDDRAGAYAELYSGRPNPGWRLSRSETATLRQMLEARTPGGPGATPPGLGYRGIVVENLGAVLPGCAQLRAYRGTVTAQCPEGARSLADTNRAVERFLAETGLKEADASAYALVQQDLAAGG